VTSLGVYLNPLEKAVVLCVDEKPKFRRPIARSRCCRCGLGWRLDAHMIMSRVARLRCSRRWRSLPAKWLMRVIRGIAIKSLSSS
jgi:hypothetical protein